MVCSINTDSEWKRKRPSHLIRLYFFIIKTCVADLVLSVTSILRAALTKIRVYVCTLYVCVCNYSSQTTEPICINISANRASYADCYRLLIFEIFTPPYLKPQKPISGGPVMLNQWEIEDSCKAHSKINRKIFAVYGSNDVVSPRMVLFGFTTMSDIIWVNVPHKTQKGRE